MASRFVGVAISMVAVLVGCGGSGDSDHRAVKVPLRGCEDAAQGGYLTANFHVLMHAAGRDSGHRRG